MSFKILEQQSVTVPDQTSSEVQMENWSKDVVQSYHEQGTMLKKKNSQPDDQFVTNSGVCMQHEHNELAKQTVFEETKLLMDNPRSFQVTDFCSEDDTINSTPEKSNIIKHRSSGLLCDFMAPCETTENVDKDKTISLLLKELNILRSSNKKLQEKLAQEGKEVKTLKLELELLERATEAKIAEKTAGIADKAYLAKRRHDVAIMSRLQLANEERDEAISRARELEKSLKELENINPEENDMTLQELLNRINNADTGRAIQSNGAIIMDRIYKTKECKEKITTEEMNAVIEERDAALYKCKRLEQELHHLKEQNQTSANNMRHLTAENNQERALKAKLLSMQQDRETAVQQYKKLKEEIQTLRIYYSLHKSLSQEESLKDQFNCTLSTYEDALKNREDIVSITHQQNEELSIQLQQALTERANMELKLQQALEASQEANEKVQKLERLVDVLRKKVGAGTIRTVI
ncbi:mirror-image polydactyly gene 1 protein [Trichosurus vulpecula]|uniref:mirror-image polydactyly gene 1 protein n=1 Tax=Trichosurus vulpecula TaxID=9337 RepID=UPI00186AF0C0|nr:mirror-image polydactyly gene 1 protein [Trichosurus vulpecula]